jgi:hypothetical protein
MLMIIERSKSTPVHFIILHRSHSSATSSIISLTILLSATCLGTLCLEDEVGADLVGGLVELLGVE